MRIVTHTCSNTEIVAALGLGDQIVGVDDHSDYPTSVVSAAARIGPDNDIDVDRVAALNPDLVITSLTIPGHEECVERLRAARLPILVVEPTHLDDVPRDIRAIAQAIDAAEAGERLAQAFETAVTAPPGAGSNGKLPRIAVEWWPKPVIVPARQSWVTQMLERCGAVNPWGEAAGKSIALDPQAPLGVDVDAVVIAWCGVPFEKYRKDVVRRRAAWASTRALREDRIVPISEAWLGRPGPRLVEGMAALRSLVQTLERGHKGGDFTP